MESTLLYDADCGFCTRAAEWLARRVPAGTVLPMQSLDLDALGVAAARAGREVPFRHADGRVTWGAAAIADALRRGGRPWHVVGAVLATPAVQVVARPGYALVARYRHRLPGGSAACALPPRGSPEGRARGG